MEHFLSTACELAIESGQLIKRLSNNRHSITFKGSVDIVTEADLQSEALIKNRILEEFPDHAFLGEESGLSQIDSDYIWIVDPLDGTTNYAHNFPVYAVSIALEYRCEVILGVIYDPNLDELFTACKGNGAFLNSKPIHVSEQTEVIKSLLATGFPYSFHNEPDYVLGCFAAFAIKAQGIRRAGAATIDLTSLACGRFDGFWELGLKPWDMAAGALIAAEAGAKITVFDGGQFDIRKPEILASNGHIHDEMLRIIHLV